MYSHQLKVSPVESPALVDLKPARRSVVIALIDSSYDTLFTKSTAACDLGGVATTMAYMEKLLLLLA